MALKPCRECKKEVATGASKCPHCGAVNPAVSNGMMMFGAVAMLGILGSCFYVFSTTPEPSPRESPPALEATVTLTATQVQVRNRSLEDWTGCTVELNPGLVRGGWAQSVPRIPAGETVEGGLMAFTRSGGERFQPGQYAVERVTVDCSQGFGAWEFR